MKLSKRQNIVYVFLILLMLVVASVSLVLNQVSDIEKLKNELAKKISELTQFHVTINDAELVISDGLAVSLRGVSLSRIANTPPDLTAQEIWVNIRLLPLLAQELVIKKILLRGSSIKVTRNSEGKFEFAGLNGILIRKNKLEENFFKSIKLGLVPQLVIQNGRVQFFDYYNNPDPTTVLLANLNASIKKLITAPTFSFIFRGEVVNEYRESSFSISGKLQDPSGGFDFRHLSIDGHISAEDIEFDTIRPYIKYSDALDSSPLAISTNSDFSWGLDRRLNLSGDFKYHPIVKQKEPSLQSSINSRQGKLDYKIQWANEILDIKEASFQSGDIQLNGSGQIREVSSTDPKISFFLKSSDLPVKRLGGYTPFKKIPESVELIRKKLGMGYVKIESLNFDGTLSQLNQLEKNSNLGMLSGEIELRKVNWDLPFVKLRKIGGTFKFNEGRGDIRIEKARCKGLPNVMLTGTILNVINRPRGDLKLEGSLPLKDMKEILVQKYSDPSFHDILSQFAEFSGGGRLQLRLIGALDNIKDLSIDGKYDFREGRLKHKQSSQKVQNVNGNIKFKHRNPKSKNSDESITSPWSIRLANFSGQFGKSSFDQMEAEILIGSDKPYLKSSGEFKIYAPELPDWIIDEIAPTKGDLLNTTELLDGTLIMKVSGESRSLDLKAQFKPQQLILQGVSLKHANLPQKITGLRGSLNFSPKEITIENLQGSYGFSDFSLKGRLGENMDVRISSPAFTFKDVPGFSWFKQLNMKGETAFETRITGTTDAANFSTRFDLTKSAYRYSNLFIKGNHSPNFFFAEGSWVAEHSITFTKLIYELGPNTIRGSGNIRLRSQPKFSLRLSGSDLKPFSLRSHIPLLRTSRSGTIWFDLVGEGNLNNFNQSIFQGSVDLKNVEFQWKNFRYPIYITAKTKFLENTLSVSSGIARASDSELRFKSKSNWGEEPFVNLTASGDKLDLNDVWPGALLFEQIRDYLQSSRVFKEGKARMIIDLRRYKFLKLDFKNLTADVSLNDRSIAINRMDMITPNQNLIKTKGMLTLTDAGKFRVKKTMTAENIEAEDYLGKWGDTFQNGLTGKVKLLQADLAVEGTSLEEFSRTLTGKVSFDLSSGKVNTGKLKRGVAILFSNENLESIPEKNSETTPYERISGDFIVKNGVAKTENYLYKTPETATSLVGTFDLNNKNMETIVGVAPLAVIDKFLTQIPVLGKILTGGEEESIVKAYYTVRGPFASPTIKSIPWTSLEKRIFGILKAILESPGDIITAPLSNRDGS
tara:strand:+ start:376 stop:4188 length:3813 start_codon:yes stop_codon:yes gene_type:complete